MANIRCYFGIENLNLTTGQKNTLITGLQALGQNNSGNLPNEKNHWRIRPDNNAVIFEALFNEDNLSIDAIKARLAAIFSVAVGTITHSTNQTAYGLVVNFVHGGQNKIRSIAFGMTGGVWPSWSDSNAAARAYLTANAAQWETGT